MSFLDRIAECNAHDLGEFTPFTVAQRRVGWVRHGLAARLAAHHPELRLGPQALALDDGLADPAARSAAMDGVVRAMEREGLVTGRRDEFYPVAAHVGAPALLQIERAAVPAFGIAACGVHMTGFVRKPDGIHIWVPRRARTKSTYPGMLDNTVAGGQPVGIGIFENLIKECAEEASIPEALARRALPAGSVSSPTSSSASTSNCRRISCRAPRMARWKDTNSGRRRASWRRCATPATSSSTAISC
jgi:hypothetical protein